ncbi:RfaG Glycosyltransferase [Methylophilaceae bacterium]
MERILFIHATNVHRGGGRSLLEAIFNTLPIGIKLILTLDSRMPQPDTVEQIVQVQHVKPTIIQRLLAEKSLANNVVSSDIVLCFGNLPPFFKLRGHAVVFVQNRYLVDDVSLCDLPLKTRLRLWLERLWLSSKMKNVDEFIVQTPSMKRLLDIMTQGKIPVTVLPFMASHEKYDRKVSVSEMAKNVLFDFLYVASGESHKNHRQLIEAWCLLAMEGKFPSLKLTLDNACFKELCSWIEQKVKQYQLNVVNVGNLSHGQVQQLYNQAGALIYPSNFESFGLPLIEARQAGLPVLASELDFVRDVLDPEQTFDPESATSIARAVKRFMGFEEQLLPLQDATGFMKHILEKFESFD